jgi:hypothetical protein
MWFGLDSSYQPTFSSIRFVPGFPIPTCLSFLHTTNLATHDQPTNRSCSTTISIPIFSIFSTLLTLDWWDTILRNERTTLIISTQPIYPTTFLPVPEPRTTSRLFSFHISTAPFFSNGTSLNVIKLEFFISHLRFALFLAFRFRPDALFIQPTFETTINLRTYLRAIRSNLNTYSWSWSTTISVPELSATIF